MSNSKIFYNKFENSTDYQCKLYPTKIKSGINGTTSPLINHLTSTHNIKRACLDNFQCNRCSSIILEDKDEKDLSKKKLNPFIISMNSLNKKRQTNNFIVKMIFKDLQPMSIVEDKGFNELIKYLYPTYNMPSRRNIDTIMTTFYGNITKKIKEEFDKASYINLTMDYWSGLNQNSILNITASFLTKDWVKKNLHLQAIEVNTNHTAENTKKGLLDVINLNNINEKVQTIITDNAPNVLNAVSLAGYKSIPDIIHALILVLKHSVEIPEINETINKSRSIVKHFKKSNLAMQQLRTIQVEKNIHTNLTLLNYSKTRWNSIFI